MSKKHAWMLSVLLVALTFTGNVFAGVELPTKKQTPQGLYVNSQEAFTMWQNNPAKVTIIDCRTPHEYNYIGHALMAYNIPAEFMTMEYDEKKKTYKTKENSKFVAQIKEKFKKDQTLLLICRSGSRSAKAAGLLAKEGFSNVYNVYDGFEGDKVKAEGSYFNGQRMVNGWKNSGNPWTYKIDPALGYVPK